MVKKIDHKQLAISRLASQFKESPQLISYIKCLLIEANTLESVFSDLITKRWIDTATGQNLDVLGTIVGQKRNIYYKGGVIELDDNEYRLFIRNKIVANTTSSTPEEIIAVMKFVFNTDRVLFIDGNTYYQIGLGKKLTEKEKGLISAGFITKTAGVNARFYSEFGPNPFAFYGVRNAFGFGTIEDPNIGGTLGNLI